MSLTRLNRKLAEDALSNMKKDHGVITANAVETGFVDLDYALGGLRKGETYLLAAGPMRGKTALVLNIAEYLAEEKKCKVAYFSLDLSMEDVIKRYVQLLLDTDECGIGHICELHKEPALESVMKKIDGSKLYVDDTYGLKLNEVMEHASEEGPFDLIIVDYVQLLSGENSDESLVWKLGQLSGMAEVLDTPILILYQLEGDRYHNPNYKPEVKDLGIPEVIRNAGNVILLSEDYTEPMDDGDFTAMLEIVKNKHGNKGTVLVEWNPMRMRFRTLGT